jgi:Tol biopolymer transport system component
MAREGGGHWSRRRLAAFAFGSAIVAACSGTPSPRSSTVPSTNALGFVCADKTTASICVANRDGTGLRVIAAGDPVDVDPAWSPDGAMVAFVCDYESDQPPVLWDNVVNYGPIGFSRSYGGEICTVDVNTGTIHKLTDTGHRANAPAWSPDGTRIAYTVGGGVIALTPGGSGSPASSAAGVGVHEIDAAGGADRLVAAGGDMASWSPDGTKLAFIENSENGSRLVVSGADGSGATPITDGAAIVLGPAWSPDGRQIAYLQLGGTQRHLNVISASGGTARQLTGGDDLDPNTGVAFTPAWSADGGHIALVEWRPDPGAVAVGLVNAADGTHTWATQTGLTSKGIEAQPAFASDGSALAFTADHDGWLRVYIGGPQGQAAKPLLAEDRVTAQAAWRPAAR